MENRLKDIYKAINDVSSSIRFLTEVLSNGNGTEGVRETARNEISVNQFKSLYYSMDRLNITVGECYEVIKELTSLDE